MGLRLFGYGVYCDSIPQYAAKIAKIFEVRLLINNFFAKNMINDYLTEQILSNFGHLPTSDQSKAISALSDFILSPNPTALFVLRGFAGTGKTSLIGALVKTMEALGRPCVLMAPTGRAAKVFSLYAAHPAYTIHRRIYRQKSMEQDAAFSLNFNKQRQVLFIVDEASMISNRADGQMLRQSLLEDLIQFVYGGGVTGCRLVLCGDTGQLPPVGETESPALQPDELRCQGMDVTMATLTEIVRQRETSGILWNATDLRHCIEADAVYDWPRIRFSGLTDVVNVPGDELIETIADCYARHGMDDTMIICRSNKRAVAYNRGIRYQILGYEDELCGGDIVMIAKNNYYWTRLQTQGSASDSDAAEAGKDAAGEPVVEYIANGDIAVVKRVWNEREFYGFRFADCMLTLPDYDDYEVTASVLLDTLHAEAPSLSHEQQEKLFEGVMEDYADIPLKRDRLKKLKEDPYYNALQLKYAYAVTCHKAQGGQWGYVFIDQGYVTEEMLDADYYRWLYTAITRAKEKVFFVNWRKEQSK